MNRNGSNWYSTNDYHTYSIVLANLDLTSYQIIVQQCCWTGENNPWVDTSQRSNVKQGHGWGKIALSASGLLTYKMNNLGTFLIFFTSNFVGYYAI